MADPSLSLESQPMLAADRPPTVPVAGMASTMDTRDFWRRTSIVAILSGGMVLAHYLTPPVAHEEILHDIYRRVLYLPVILSAFWFGWRGGLLCAGLITAAYFPHIYHDWGGDFFDTNLNRTLEAVMYLIVGGITGLLTDRLRGANRRLLRKSDQLEVALSELREKTGEAFTAEQQLRQADRLTTIGQLTTGLAHEIRNPLGSIRGAAEILGDPDTDPQRRHEFSSVLIEETGRLDRVLSNFLDYAKTQKPDQPALADLKDVLERLSSLVGMKLRAARIEMETRLNEPLPPLRVPEALLQQVMLNLVLNSIQAMPDGGVIVLEARNDGPRKRIEIAVCDTGPGIPAALREHVFEPFFTTKQAGTGLGLSIVQKIVLGNHGRVWVDEEYRKGARIVVEFPAG